MMGTFSTLADLLAWCSKAPPSASISITECLTPGQVFNGKEAVAWFAERYPKIKDNTVSMHVEGMAVNSNRRKHVSNARAGGGFDLFYKLVLCYKSL